jgi:hypothetical protein
MTAMLKYWGHVIHRWKGIFKTFLAVYQKPQFLKFQFKQEHKILALIYGAKLKGAHERFKILVGTNLEPKCKP